MTAGAAAATERVAVVGTGVIGAGWTALFLARGLQVSAYDPSPGAEPRLRAAVDEAWPALTRLGLADGADPARLSFTDHAAAAVARAEFVQESGPERIDVKRRLIAELDEAAPAEVPIASSSSTLMPSDLRARCRVAPGRVLVGHPFSPAHLIPLVEVVPGPGADEHALARAMAFYVSIGKRPILVRKEVPGHVTIRLQAALWREAYSLVERGVASVADIDAAIAHGPGLRWALIGPLMTQHVAGGPGGMAHTLAHLGPPAQAVMDDLREARLTPELATLLVRGIDEELRGIDPQGMIAARDELLVLLVESKRRHNALP